MSEPSVIGWEPMQAEWWLVIRATLPKPWPREAVLMDLRFWKGQEVATAHRAERLRVKRPGRPTLLKEWGWTDWAVKEAFKAEDEWARPGAEVAASAPPAHRQLPASYPPAVERLEAKNIEDSASLPPAYHQPTTSAPPRARSLLRDPEIQSTEGEERGEPPTRQPQQESPPGTSGGFGGASGHPASPESNVGQASATPAPSLPVPAEGDLLPLLMKHLAGGHAVQVARKLYDAGVSRAADADALDEFNIGQIVGSGCKVGTLKALRDGGWLPPKERSARPVLPVLPAGCPPGVKPRTLFSRIGKEESDAQQPRRDQRAS